MSKLLKLSNLQSSKELLLTLEELVEMNHIKQQNDFQFQTLLSRLKKQDKQKKQQTQSTLRKNKIKKNKRNNKKKSDKPFNNIQEKQSSQDSNQFLDYLRCDQELIQQNYTIFRNKLIQSQNQFKQNQDQILEDFTTDLIEKICYQNDRRKSLLQLQAKQFMNILIKIQNQFDRFMEKINQSPVVLKMGFRQKKINQSNLQNQFIQQILLSIPEIKEVLQNFQEKYCSDQYYKNQYRQLLTKKRIIYNIKKIIDRQNQSEQEDYCTHNAQKYFFHNTQKLPQYKINMKMPSQMKHFEFSSQSQYWSQTQEIYSILNKKSEDQTQKQYFSYNWQDMKLRLKQFSIKIQEQMNQKSKKNKKKNQKKKKAAQNMKKQANKQDYDEEANKLADFLQKLEIDPLKTIECRLDDNWIDSFNKKYQRPIKNSQQNKLKQFILRSANRIV